MKSEGSSQRYKSFENQNVPGNMCDIFSRILLGVHTKITETFLFIFLPEKKNAVK